MKLYDNVIVGQTQRNWDHSKPIPDEHIKVIVEAAHHAPFKQSIEAFRMFVSTNMDFNNMVYKWGHDKNLENEEQRWLNGQLAAPLLICFAMYEMDSIPEIIRSVNSREENIFSSGVVAGITALTANGLGYKTGFCGCVQWREMISEFKKETGSKVLKEFWEEKHIAEFICLGIGHPLENYHRGTSIIDGKKVAYNPPALKRKTPTLLYKQYI